MIPEGQPRRKSLVLTSKIFRIIHILALNSNTTIVDGCVPVLDIIVIQLEITHCQN